jgi:CRP-like cAMP-binding protein
MLILEANNLVLNDSPVFRDNFSSEIICKTVSIIKEFRCTPEEVIYTEGEIDDGCIYFIEKGSVEMYIDTSLGCDDEKECFKEV